MNPLSNIDRRNGERLLAIVARYYGITTDDLLSDSREQHKAFPRQVACAVMRRRGWQQNRIASLVERDHSTVHHAIKTVEARANTEWETRTALNEIEREWSNFEDGQLGYIRRAVEQVHQSAREGRIYLQELEREADALLNKIAQVERMTA